MLLDEPTTHLDLDGIKALTTAFKSYEGTICFISHDLFFIREVADCIVEVGNGEIKTYTGGLEYYLEKRKEQDAIVSREKAAIAEQDRKSKREKKLESKEAVNPKLFEMQQQHKAALKRIAEIKNKLKSFETEKQELETESYVKARMLSQSSSTITAEVRKEYGQRLKNIQTRLREIESTGRQLQEEKDAMSK